MPRLLLYSALFSLMVPACRRHAARPADARAEHATRAPGEGGGEGAGGGENAGGGEGGGAPEGEDGDAPAGGRRFHEATVYVDGVATVAFTYNEMPPGVKIHKLAWDEGESFSHFLVCDYFKQLGVDCAQVKETHWYAGRNRVAIITGSELRKNRERLFFNFTRELGGKPRVEWANGVQTNDHVDLVSDLAIYVHKKPPRWDKQGWELVDDEGRPYDGIPYNHDEVRGGARVSVDGRLVARIKRNLLEGNVTPVGDAPDGSGSRYALTAFLAQRGARLGTLRGVDLITRDERVIRVTGADAQGVSFAAPRQRHGEVMAYFGAHYAPIAAVAVYSRFAPPERAMRTYTFRGAAASTRGADSQSPTKKTQGRRGPEAP